jgi:hypothetical protein
LGFSSFVVSRETGQLLRHGHRIKLQEKPFLILLYVIQSSIYKISEYPGKTRLLGAVLLGVAFVGIFWSTAREQWREEQAALPEGNLVGAGPVLEDGKQHGFPMAQIGEGTIFVMTPDGVSDIFPFFKDAGVKIEWKNGAVANDYC